MIGYVCKYTPVEALRAMGAQVERIEAPEGCSSFDAADERLHANLCSFAKAAYQAVLAGDYEGVVLTTCCDSMRRLADALTADGACGFVQVLDVPRSTDDAAAELFESRVRALLKAYGGFSGAQFSENALLVELGGTPCPAGEGCEPPLPPTAGESMTGQTKDTPGLGSAKRKEGCEASDCSFAEPSPNAITAWPAMLSPSMPNIAVMGARANPQIRRMLEDGGANLAFDFTCTGTPRRFTAQRENTLASYCRELLGQFPCVRMSDTTAREQTMEAALSQVDGLVYHTVQFCDLYSYEYFQAKRAVVKPLLALETDCTPASAGQVRTRLEAFLESIHAQGNAAGTARKQPSEQQAASAANGRFVVGVDSGSTSTNAVVMNANRQIVATAIVRTGAKATASAERALAEALEHAGLSRGDIARIVATGYGRVSIPFADENTTEISCHGKGAHYFDPRVRTILDIGGQDSKAIRVNAAGEAVDFAMNDKCAAGTGRFLEMIARSLETSLDDLGPAALKSSKRLEIASMCSVFAESEVITLVANNEELSDIAAGVCRAVAGKAYSLMRRVGLEGAFMMTGGVARNPGVVAAVEELLGDKLIVCPEPDIVGATGAALKALEQL